MERKTNKNTSLEKKTKAKKKMRNNDQNQQASPYQGHSNA